MLPPSLRACAGSYIRPPRRRPRNCGDCGAECQRARVCAINRHRRCSGCYRRKQRKQPRTFSSHASTAHLDATLAHSFTITATCMHKHTQRGSTYRAPSTCTLLHHHCNTRDKEVMVGTVRQGGDGGEGVTRRRWWGGCDKEAMVRRV